MTRTKEIIPNADEYVPALEHEGYEPPTAIADLIDNSISAGATDISIKFNWDNGYDASIVIIDNGCGMDEEGLIRAMRLASNSKKPRGMSDLGRFGMGLKTGGFSLGRRISLISKTMGTISSVSWDLSKYEDPNYISDPNTKGWLVDVDIIEDEKYNQYLHFFETQTSGTILIIDKLHQVQDLKHLDKKHNEFYSEIERIKSHLSLIYHRLLSDNDPEKQLKINVEGEVLNPWDPFFMTGQDLGEIVIRNVKIHPYVMPNPSRLTDDEKKILTRASKKNEMAALMKLQGFYLYRNNRLIEYGTWYNLCKSNIAYNLARIQIDIPADLDDEWMIDLKKSKARPPAEIKDPYLKNVMMRATQSSLQTLNSREIDHRNVKLPPIGALWRQDSAKTHKSIFVIDKTHPLYKQTKKTMTDIQKEAFDTYLSALENTFPPIQSLVALDEDTVSMEDLEQLVIDEDLDKMRHMINALRKLGYDVEGIKEELGYWPQFYYLKDSIDKLLSET